MRPTLTGLYNPDLVRLDRFGHVAVLQQRSRLRLQMRDVPRGRVAGGNPLVPLLARHADALGEGLVYVSKHLRQSSLRERMVRNWCQQLIVCFGGMTCALVDALSLPSFGVKDAFGMDTFDVSCSFRVNLGSP